MKKYFVVFDPSTGLPRVRGEEERSPYKQYLVEMARRSPEPVRSRLAAIVCQLQGHQRRVLDLADDWRVIALVAFFTGFAPFLIALAGIYWLWAVLRR